MTNTVAEALAWSRFGTAQCQAALGGIDAGRLGDVLAGPSLLPGWSRKHVVAHLVGNAEALLNLTHWAATGIETPMYASPEQRQQGIDQGVELDPSLLVDRFEETSARFEQSVLALTERQLAAPIRTAQGRTLRAGEVAWLRARETCVHAVDLDLGIGFDALPEAFLVELAVEVEQKRGGELPDTPGPLAHRVAWLVGRPHPARLVDGSAAPELSAWL